MFIRVYCYNCSTLSLIIIINLSWYLIYTLNFITGMYVLEETVLTGFGTICDFRHPRGEGGGILEHIPLQLTGATAI